MGIRIYTEKVKTPGSKFQEYALLSKLTDSYLIKHMRFIDPIVDDDGNIFPFVRRDHIIFISGLAVSAKSLVDFLNNITAESYTDHPTAIFVKQQESDPIVSLITALEKIQVVNIYWRQNSIIEIIPNATKIGSPWKHLFDMIHNVIQIEEQIIFEDEVTDF